MMFNARLLLTLATSALFGAACAGYSGGGGGTASGDVVTKEEASKTVVLHVDNLSSSSMELRTIADGRSVFVGSVSARDSTNILLDPSLFPTGSLYLTALPSDRRGQARVGPLAAGRGDIIKFTIQPSLDLSRALVVR
jgi:hypothetical protein